MDATLKAARRALLATVLSPLIPQIIGSIFNIWYNTVVVNPLLNTPELKHRFAMTVVLCNGIIYPAGVYFWYRFVYQLRPALDALAQRTAISEEGLNAARRRLIFLPWTASIVAAIAWFACIPIFLGALASVECPPMAPSDPGQVCPVALDSRVYWHLPISFAVSGFIAITHAFFLVELCTQQRLFPLFFQNARPDRTPGARPLSLRGRGMVWAVSMCICPLVSLLLLSFAPKTQGSEWFELFVAVVGIGFGVFSVTLIDKLVAHPIDQLRGAVVKVTDGHLQSTVPIQRADEIGVLAAEVNEMIGELRTAQSVRQTFGLHVGRRVAERLLERDACLSGIEETITVMFVDIRNFTTRSKGLSAREVVAGLNEFLAVMVDIVESRHGGMINKYLGDGFMAIFGAIEDGARVNEAVAASRDMLAALTDLNVRMSARGDVPLAIGIGLHTGEAVVGSIGSPARLEFTAIGSTVNLASRVEGMTKVVGAPLLFTEETRRELKGSVEVIDTGAHPVRGMPEPVRLFTVK